MGNFDKKIDRFLEIFLILGIIWIFNFSNFFFSDFSLIHKISHYSNYYYGSNNDPDITVNEDGQLNIGDWEDIVQKDSELYRKYFAEKNMSC